MFIVPTVFIFLNEVNDGTREGLNLWKNKHLPLFLGPVSLVSQTSRLVLETTY